MNENKKEVADEINIQKQPIKVEIQLVNADELKTIIDEINEKLIQLKNFKLEVNTKIIK